MVAIAPPTTLDLTTRHAGLPVPHTTLVGGNNICRGIGVWRVKARGLEGSPTGFGDPWEGLEDNPPAVRE